MSSVNNFGQPVGWPLNTDLPRPAPEHCVLRGSHCVLEPLALKHASDLFKAFQANPSGFTYLPDDPFESEEDCAKFVNWAAQSKDPLFFAICTPDGRALGHASFLRIAPDVGSIEVGYIHFADVMRKTPIATEAMYLMMHYVFETLGYRRYEWKCDALNGPSRGAAARFGFTFEGIFRQASAYKGRNRDTAWFSVLDSEWPAHKAEFERWLNTSNFDADGRQKSRLAIKPVT